MALMMTHIRFALELAERFSISDMQAYLSGTVYPDSRWVTGIDRDLTHADRFRSADFPEDDFTRGWQVHCICDFLQNRIFEAYFPEYSRLSREDKWVQMSVAKLIQDMNDLQQFDFQSRLPDPQFARTPNGEDINRVRRFYEIIRDTYRHLRVPTPDEYRQLWLDVGLSGTLADRIINGLQEQLQNDRQVALIEGGYDEICQELKGITL